MVVIVIGLIGSPPGRTIYWWQVGMTNYVTTSWLKIAAANLVLSYFTARLIFCCQSRLTHLVWAIPMVVADCFADPGTWSLSGDIHHLLECGMIIFQSLPHTKKNKYLHPLMQVYHRTIAFQFHCNSFLLTEVSTWSSFGVVS